MVNNQYRTPEVERCVVDQDKWRCGDKRSVGCKKIMHKAATVEVDRLTMVNKEKKVSLVVLLKCTYHLENATGREGDSPGICQRV